MNMKSKPEEKATLKKHSKVKCGKAQRSERDGALIEASSKDGKYTPGSLTELLQKFSESAESNQKRPSKNSSEEFGRPTKRTKGDGKAQVVPAATEGVDDGSLPKVQAFFSTSSVSPPPKSHAPDEFQSANVEAATLKTRRGTQVSTPSVSGSVGSVFSSRSDKKPSSSSARLRSSSALSECSSGGSDSSDGRLRRTLFVGNLPLLVKFKPSELFRHLGLAPSQVESIRFRSIPVDPKFQNCKRAGIAQQKFAKGCDSQNAYLVLNDEKLVQELQHKELAPFLEHDLRLDSAGRTGFSLYDRKRSICVGGLPKSATEKDLKTAVERFGKVENCRILRDRVTGASKKIGFVCFQDRVSATKAVIEGTCSILGRDVRLMRALTEEQSKAQDAARLRKSKKGKKSKESSPALRRIMEKKALKKSRRAGSSGSLRVGTPGSDGGQSSEKGKSPLRGNPSSRAVFKGKSSSLFKTSREDRSSRRRRDASSQSVVQKKQLSRFDNRGGNMRGSRNKGKSSQSLRGRPRR